MITWLRISQRGSNENTVYENSIETENSKITEVPVENLFL